MDKETKTLADKMIDYMGNGHTFTEAMEHFSRPVLINKAKEATEQLKAMMIADLK